MRKVGAVIEKMRGVGTFMRAVGTLKRISLLHEEQSIRSAVSIGKKSFKNKWIRMLSPSLVQSGGKSRRSMRSASPRGGRTLQTHKKCSAKGFTDIMLEGLNIHVDRVPHNRVLGIAKEARRLIKVPANHMKVIKKVFNGTFTRFGGVEVKMLKKDGRAHILEVSVPIRKRGVGGSKRVIQRVSL